VPTGKKKLLIDGKAPSFHPSRGFIAAILIAAVAMVGFAFVRWYDYNRIVLPTRSMTVIEPRFTIKDTIEFEATPRNVELELDLLVAGNDKSFQFRIPASFIQRANSAIFGLIGQQPIQVAQAPPDPEKDPRIRSAVKAAYREGMKQIRRSTVSMSPKAAVSKQRKEEATLIRALADQFTLRVEQINRMIGDP
jgi:hypothetical protein